MNPPASLNGPHRRTYEAIFRHPVAHNVAWQDVRALLSHLAQLVEEPDGNLKVARNGEVLVLPPPRATEVSTTKEIMALRHFLQRSEATSEPAAENDAPWLLVISHHEARLYRSTAPGAIAQLFRPHLPADFFRPAPGVKNFSRGREKPEPSSLFEPVAAVLRGAGRILIFGGGTGVGGAMEQFVAWANACRPELAGRIIGAVSAYESNLSEEQLLAKARAYHAGALVV